MGGRQANQDNRQADDGNPNSQHKPKSKTGRKPLPKSKRS
jgi:hypothetical protein